MPLDLLGDTQMIIGPGGRSDIAGFETVAENLSPQDAAFIVRACIPYDSDQAKIKALVEMLKSVELRLTQARIASNIGRESSVKKADFLRGECESIARDVRATLESVTP